MTPQEIFEYRNKWMKTGNNHPVSVHSDMRSRAKGLCKIQMFPQQWKEVEYTDNYEDTYYFEYRQDAEYFSGQFKEWITKNG